MSLRVTARAGCRARMPRASAARAAARRHAMQHACGARRWHACQPSPQVRPGDRPGQIGQAGDPRIVTRAKNGPPRRGPGRQRAWGAGRRIRPRARGAGRWSAPPSARANLVPAARCESQRAENPRTPASGPACKVRPTRSPAPPLAGQSLDPSPARPAQAAQTRARWPRFCGHASRLLLQSTRIFQPSFSGPYIHQRYP